MVDKLERKREIKFRAWHKNAKYMCMNATTDLLDRDYLVFMQYTGEKDKNGKEIYEGDVVEIDRLYKFKNKGIVIFDHGAYKVRHLVNDDMGQNIAEDISFLTYTRNYRFSSVRIIGNIYDNPELLK